MNLPAQRHKFMMCRLLTTAHSATPTWQALDTYQAHKQSYHPIASKMVAVDLKLSKPSD